MALQEKEWFIQAPWGRLCIVAWGNCFDPPVFVCHGQNDSAASFRPLLQLLPKNFYYVGMELPGNGKSDSYPRGMMISVLDLIYPLEVVRKHFRWEKFVYISHSISTTVGRLYNISYPGRMTKVIELDPITPSLSYKPEEFAFWYDRFFKNFYDKYEMYNSPQENSPKYTWEEVLAKLEKFRGLTPEKARPILERFTEPAGHELIRLTLDQRMKNITRPPFAPQQLEEFLIGNRTPTLAVIANGSIKHGLYRNSPYLLEERKFEGTYRVRKVDGTHDVHIIHPERVAPYISQFLLHGFDGLDGKAKL